PAYAPPLRAQLLDNESRLERHWPGHIVEVGRSRHHRLVDLGELFLGAVALDADDIAQLLVARRHGGIDAEEAPQIDLAVGFDLQAFEGDPAHCALRDEPDRHAGVERRQQMLLRIGEPVRATQFAGFVDIDRKPPRHALAADLEALDLRAAPRLALPGRGNAPAGFGRRGAPLGAFDQG